MAKATKSPVALPATVGEETFQYGRKKEDGEFTVPIRQFVPTKPEELKTWLPVWGFTSLEDALCYFVNREWSKSAIASHREAINEARKKGEKELEKVLATVREETRESYWTGPRSSDGMTAKEKQELGSKLATAAMDPEKAKILKELGLL